MQGKIFENHHSLNNTHIGISSQMTDFLLNKILSDAQIHLSLNMRFFMFIKINFSF